jgi:pyruvate, orthophosphate dikinase
VRAHCRGPGFFERAGLAYVSCSPFRVPVARLAAAQAALRRKAAKRGVIGKAGGKKEKLIACKH